MSEAVLQNKNLEILLVYDCRLAFIIISSFVSQNPSLNSALLCLHIRLIFCTQVSAQG